MSTWVLIIIILGGETPTIEVVSGFNKETCMDAKDAVMAALSNQGRGYLPITACVTR